MKRSEHIARAMLLGWVYSWRYGYYHTPMPIKPRRRWDAMTLDEITDKAEVVRRQKHNFHSEGPYHPEEPEDENT